MKNVMMLATILFLMPGAFCATTSSDELRRAVERIGKCEHWEDIDAALRHAASLPGVTREDMSGALSEIAEDNHGMTNRLSRTLHIRALSALREYGTTNAIACLERAVSSDNPVVRLHAVRPYLRLASGSERCLTFAERIMAGTSASDERMRKIVRDHFVKELSDSKISQERRRKINQMLARPQASGSPQERESE